MKKKNFAAVFALVSVLLAANSGAATLSIEPGLSSVASGSVFSLDLVVSGLGDGAAPSIAAFDIDIGFDPFALGFVSLTLGADLGDVGLGEAIDVSFGEFIPGVINVAEVSFLSDGELDAMQPDIFVLATLDFMVLGLGAGGSTFVDVIAVLSLGDALGAPVTVDGLSGATVTLVPLPAAFWLFASSAAALFGIRRRRPSARC